MSDHNFLVNGANYFVRLQGNGPPLILLHGFTGSSADWADFAQDASGNYLTVAIDILGHGKTDSPAEVRRYEIEQVASDVTSIIRELSIEPVNLLGYSMGGRLALQITVTYPSLVASLILESASPGLDDATERSHRQRRDDDLADWIELHGIETFVRGWEQLPLFASQENLPAEIKEKQRKKRMNNNPVGLANSLRGMGTGVQPSIWAQLAGIKQPSLIIAGQLDSKYADLALRIRSNIPGAEMEILRGIGHNVHLERPQHFAQLVLGWLQQLADPEGQDK